MELSIVIVNWNTKDLLLSCLTSIYQTIREISFEIWLVDNASTDGSVEAVRLRFPEVNMIVNERNRGFAAANNMAFKQMNGRYALLINTDAQLTPGAAKELHLFMETHPQAAMACGQLLNQDDSKQNSIANFPCFLTSVSNETIWRILLPNKFPSKRKTYTDPIEVESCIGACMIVRRKAMSEVGFLDERYFFFFEETDWAKRMQNAGWKVHFVPTAKVYHAQGQSVGRNANARITFYRSRYIYFRKWHERTLILLFAVIFLRLMMNTLLSFIGILFTLGLKKTINRRFMIYLHLIAWHLKGCP